MAKRNLFQKVLAGVLAAGMVVTMLPGMSLTAKAADATLRRAPGDVRVRIYRLSDLNATEKANPWNVRSSVKEGAAGITFNQAEDTDFVIVPGTWYDWEETQCGIAAITNDSDALYVEGNGKSDAFRMIGRNTADESGRSYIVRIPKNTVAAGAAPVVDIVDPEPLTVSLVIELGEGVKGNQNNFEPREDRPRRLDPNSTVTYDARFVPLEDVGTMTADQIFNGEIDGEYQIRRRDSVDGGWKPITGTTGGISIKPDAAGTAQVPTNNDNYGEEIVLAFSKSKDSFGSFSIGVLAEGKINKGTETNYRLHELVDPVSKTNFILTQGPQDGMSIANYGYVWSNGVIDETNYLGIRSINNQPVVVDDGGGTAAYNDTKGVWADMTEADDTKKVYGWVAAAPMSINSKALTTHAENVMLYDDVTNNANTVGFNDDNLPDTIEEEITFLANIKNQLALYVWGWASDGTVAADGVKTTGGANIDGLLRAVGERYNRADAPRYQDYKIVTLKLGTTVAEGKYKFENGMEVTDSVSVRNIYRYSYVFRTKDGYRFDQTTGNVWSYDSLATEPIEYPHDTMVSPFTSAGTVADYAKYRGFNNEPSEKYLSGAKEGDTIEFMVKFDPLYDNSNAVVVAYGYDDRGVGGRKRELVEYDKETGLCKFTFGNKFPYRFTVEGVDPKKKVTLSVIPEKDYIFEATHDENFTTLINEFYGYEPFFMTKTGGVSNTCNYANPRFQIFVEAHEEDIALLDLVAFARRQVVGGAENYIGHSFPVGGTKFKIRFNDTFTNQAGDVLNEINDGHTGFGNVGENYGRYMHGSFDLDRSDDRYGKGPDFKLLVNGKEVTVADDDTFEIELSEDTKIEAEGIVRKYYVYMPKLAGFNFELDPAIEQQREEYQRYGELDREQGSITRTQYDAIDFRSSVIEGGQYKFKLNLTEAAANSRPVVKADNSVLTPDKDGWYSFEVNSDTFVTVDGITVNNAFKDTQNLPQEEQDAIDWLLANGMTVGDGDGNFMPQSNTKRGDFVLMLYRYYGQPAATGNGGFSDVAADAYYANAIAWGSGKGIVNGYPDGTFRPNNIITRAEVANILSKLCGLNSGTANPFVDVNAGDWFYNAVNRCFAAGIVNGTTQTTFTPNAGIIRAHYALMLYRSHSMLPAK